MDLKAKKLGLIFSLLPISYIVGEITHILLVFNMLCWALMNAQSCELVEEILGQKSENVKSSFVWTLGNLISPIGHQFPHL